jgi:hypothetical protein
VLEANTYLVYKIHFLLQQQRFLFQQGVNIDLSDRGGVRREEHSRRKKGSDNQKAIIILEEKT